MINNEKQEFWRLDFSSSQIYKVWKSLYFQQKTSRIQRIRTTAVDVLWQRNSQIEVLLETRFMSGIFRWRVGVDCFFNFTKQHAEEGHMQILKLLWTHKRLCRLFYDKNPRIWNNLKRAWVISDALHLAFVLSTVAHANIKSIDISEAKKVPGFVDFVDVHVIFFLQEKIVICKKKSRISPLRTSPDYSTSTWQMIVL